MWPVTAGVVFVPITAGNFKAPIKRVGLTVTAAGAAGSAFRAGIFRGDMNRFMPLSGAAAWSEATASDSTGAKIAELNAPVTLDEENVWFVGVIVDDAMARPSMAGLNSNVLEIDAFLGRSSLPETGNNYVARMDDTAQTYAGFNFATSPVAAVPAFSGGIPGLYLGT